MYQPKHNFTMVAGKYRIRVDRSVWGTVLTIIIINTNHKEGKKKNTHTYNNTTLGDNISIFKEFRSASFGETCMVTFCQKIQYHILISSFFIFCLILPEQTKFSWPVFNILFCLLNLYCQKPIIIQSKKVTYSLIGDLVKNISFVFI